MKQKLTGLHPVGDMVLLVKEDLESDSGIVLLDTKDPNTDTPCRFKLVEVGEGKKAQALAPHLNKYVTFTMLRPRMRDEIDEGRDFVTGERKIRHELLMDADDIRGIQVWSDEA